MSLSDERTDVTGNGIFWIREDKLKAFIKELKEIMKIGKNYMTLEEAIVEVFGKALL